MIPAGLAGGGCSEQFSLDVTVRTDTGGVRMSEKSNFRVVFPDGSYMDMAGISNADDLIWFLSESQYEELKELIYESEKSCFEKSL